MDTDFMNNLSNMLKNGNIPDEMKEKLNGFLNQNTNTTNANKNAGHFETSEAKQDSQNSSNSINPDMLQNLMKMFSGTKQDASEQTRDSSASSDTNNFNNIDIGTILKLKSMMDKMQNTKDDPRSNLLLSLKPYLKDSRKSKVEQYVQLFNMTKIFEAFNEKGGEQTK